MRSRDRDQAPGVTRSTGRSPALPVVASLHLIGWGTLLALVVPAHLIAGTGARATVFGVGLGATAYALGLRHAFDADHIAAIDNTTRRLLAEGRPATSVGLWFSLGHSSVVVALCTLLVLGVHAVRVGLADDHSVLHTWTGVIGPVVSGVFLLGIAVLNLVGLARRRAGAPHHHAGTGGPVTALLARAGAVVDRPSRMYVVGLLFGLGFDTATEIGLLALAGSASVGSVPWWAVLTLPVLFAAGMSLLDAAQGAMSRRAYAWGMRGGATAARRYDVLVTVISIGAAVAIGVVELAGVATAELPSALAWLAPIGDADLDTVGFWLTGVLLAAWMTAALTVRPARPAGTAGPARVVRLVRLAHRARPARTGRADR